MFRLLFYPGVIVHEFSHLIMCLLLGVKVSKLSFGLNESYVKHANTGPIKMALIALAPFYLGAILGTLGFYFGKMNLSGNLILFLIFNYVGICILYNSIPSHQDTKNILGAIEEGIKKEWKLSFLNKLFVLIKLIFLYTPLFIIAQIVNIFEKFEFIKVLYVLVVLFYVYGAI